MIRSGPFLLWDNGRGLSCVCAMIANRDGTGWDEFRSEHADCVDVDTPARELFAELYGGKPSDYLTSGVPTMTGRDGAWCAAVYLPFGRYVASGKGATKAEARDAMLAKIRSDHAASD